MKEMNRESIPRDYFYYRNNSLEYRRRIMHHFAPKGAIAIKERECFGRIKHYLGGTFSLARFEKTDIDIGILKKYGMKRGCVLWSGWSHYRPKSIFGWIPLGYIFSQMYHHSTRSAFSILDTQEYWTKWKSNARNHRNKIVKNIQLGNITIFESSPDQFLDAYKKTKLPHSLKSYLSKKTKELSLNSHNTRFFLAANNGEILAGIFLLDTFPTSTYMVAFQDEKGKKYHLGLALVDRWFEDSYKKGFKYLDFDHMKDFLDSPSFRGYTIFKSELVDYEIQFHNVWMKLFF